MVFCKTILGCEILNVHTFWKTLFSNGYFGNAFVYQCKQKRSIWIISQRMVSISSVEATNHQYQHQLQASNTISFASLSAHCLHSDCVDRSVVHLGKTATKQRNLLMDDIYLEFYLNLKIVCSCNNKPKTSHIFCPFQVLKEELYWNRIEKKKENLKQTRNMC